MHSKHSWIHGSYGATILRVTCPDKIGTVTTHLSGTNLVEIRPGCIGHTRTVTLYSSMDEINPKSNFTLSSLNDTVTVYGRIPELQDEILSSSSLLHKSRLLDDITKEAQEISTHARILSRSETTWTFLQILTGTLVIVSLLYLVFKLRLWKVLLCLCKPCNFYNCFNTNTAGQHHYNTASSMSMHYKSESPTASGAPPPTTPNFPTLKTITSPTKRLRFSES